MSADEQDPPTSLASVVPTHGRGKLLPGGKPGNASKGTRVAREQARLRKGLRGLLGGSIAAIRRQLEASEFSGQALPLDDLIALTNTAARYAVGTQHEETRTEVHRYVVQLPQRRSLAAMLAEAGHELPGEIVPSVVSRALSGEVSPDTSTPGEGDAPSADTRSSASEAAPGGGSNVSRGPLRPIP